MMVACLRAPAAAGKTISLFLETNKLSGNKFIIDAHGKGIADEPLNIPSNVKIT